MRAGPEHPLVPDQCLLHRSCCQRFPALLPVGGAEGLDKTFADLVSLGLFSQVYVLQHLSNEQNLLNIKSNCGLAELKLALIKKDLAELPSAQRALLEKGEVCSFKRNLFLQLEHFMKLKPDKGVEEVFEAYHRFLDVGADAVLDSQRYNTRPDYMRHM